MTARLLLTLLALAALPAQAQVFLPDDPLRTDNDTLLIAEPAEQELSDVYDFVENIAGQAGDYDGPALDVNTLGEVPNSSWFTERHYARRLSAAALERGSLRGTGPAFPWTVLRGKAEGKTPGMLIEDARGDRYLLKFDPPGFNELATGAEGVVTPLFYALGYNVPENYVVRFQRDQLQFTEDSEITGGRVDTLLAPLDRYPDGAYRALASKYLSGRPIGPYKYFGTRADDPNDVIPHEGRRVLRGLRVFGAWTNHDDFRSINSLDTFIGDSTGGFVRHHLIDVSATLGAGVRGAKVPADETEYAFHPARIFQRLFTLNIARSEWMDREYTLYPSIGRFDYEHFDPEGWRQQYPNAAFLRMDRDDAFWGAARVMHFTDDDVRTLVAAGQYTDPEAAAYLARALMERRDRIGAAFLPWGGGLDRFRVENNRLVFDDLLAMHGLDGAGQPRTVAWRAFDNGTGALSAPMTTAAESASSVALPARTDLPFLVADITTPGLGTTSVALRRGASGSYAPVGVDRCAEGEPCGEFRPAPLPAFAER